MIHPKNALFRKKHPLYIYRHYVSLSRGDADLYIGGSKTAGGPEKRAGLERRGVLPSVPCGAARAPCAALEAPRTSPQKTTQGSKTALRGSGGKGDKRGTRPAGGLKAGGAGGGRPGCAPHRVGPETAVGEGAAARCAQRARRASGAVWRPEGAEGKEGVDRNRGSPENMAAPGSRRSAEPPYGPAGRQIL